MSVAILLLSLNSLACTNKTSGAQDSGADGDADSTDAATSDDFDGDADADADSDSDTDADTDADADGDTDADADADADGDADADADADADSDGDGEALNCISMQTSFSSLHPSGALSLNYICGVKPDGEPLCWNRDGSDPYPPPPGLSLVEIALNQNGKYGRTTAGEVVRWGENGSSMMPEPGEVLDIDSSGNAELCLLQADQTVRCYANAEYSLQVPQPEGPIVKVVSLRGQAYCMLMEDQSIVCAHGSDSWSCMDVDPPCCLDNWCDIGLSTVSGSFMDIDASRFYTCGLRVDGAPVCWRIDGVPVTTAPMEESFVQIAVGQTNSCGLRADGSVRCWYNAQTGTKTLLPEDKTYKYVERAGNLDVTCAIEVDGPSICCGSSVPHPDSAEAQNWPP